VQMVQILTIYFCGKAAHDVTIFGKDERT